MKTSLVPSFLVAGVFAALASVASADVLSLNVSGDSFIRSSSATGNNATSNLLLVGDTATANDYIRSVLSFDLSAPELAGATINSVSLVLTAFGLDTSGGGSQPGTQTIQVFLLDQAFTDSSVTWNSASAGTAWTSAGGAFTTLLSSTTADASTVTANQVFTFADSSAFTTSVVSSIGQSIGLLVKLQTEDATRSIFRFNAGIGTNLLADAYRPKLVIDYTPASPVPEPSAFAALAGLGALGLVASRRRARR